MLITFSCRILIPTDASWNSSFRLSAFFTCSGRRIFIAKWRKLDGSITSNTCDDWPVFAIWPRSLYPPMTSFFSAIAHLSLPVLFEVDPALGLRGRMVGDEPAAGEDFDYPRGLRVGLRAGGPVPHGDAD